MAGLSVKKALNSQVCASSVHWMIQVVDHRLSRMRDHSRMIAHRRIVIGSVTIRVVIVVVVFLHVLELPTTLLSLL